MTYYRILVSADYHQSYLQIAEGPEGLAYDDSKSLPWRDLAGPLPHNEIDAMIPDSETVFL